jgi:hypothetical protein
VPRGCHSLGPTPVFKAFHHYCGQLGAVFIIIDLPGPPIASIDAVTEAFHTALAKLGDPWTGFDDRTGVTTGRFGSLPLHPHERAPIRLACLDHIPSACPYTLPLDVICPMLREAGVQEIFVDGAHVPGQLDMEVTQTVTSQAIQIYDRTFFSEIACSRDHRALTTTQATSTSGATHRPPWPSYG